VLVDEAIYVNGVRKEGHDPAGTGGFSWVGILDPTFEELVEYQHHFHFNDLALEDAVTAQQRPKVDQFADHSFLVVKTVAYGGVRRPLVIGDVCIFFSFDTVVTVRHGEVMPLTTIRGDLEAQTQRLALGSTAVVHEILDRLVDQYVEVSQLVARDVRQLEDEVFEGSKPASSRGLYAVKRELIEFRRAVSPLVEPVSCLVDGKVNFVSPDFTYRFSDVRDHLLKVVDEIDAMERLVDAAIQANLALASVRQNEDMRRISAWVGIAAVPTMIAGIYGMNFENMPELGTRWGYYAVVGVMGAVSLGLFRLFRRNKWL
jgi:magnesium transporter